MTFNQNYSLLSIYQQSLKYYKSKKVDDKKLRAKLDIISAKIIFKNGFQYDRSTRTWVQSGKTAKLTIMVSSKPISYKKSDTVPTHKFPVIMQFEDISKGALSAIKWRTGSQKKFIKKLPTLNSVQIANLNIRNEIQAQFMFHLEYALKIKGLLFGICRPNRRASKTNPKQLIYFDKHALFCCEKIILPLLNNKTLINRVLNPTKK